MAKHAVGGDSTLGAADFDGAAVVEKVERFKPGVLAFVGKRAAREVLRPRKPGSYGEQDVTIGETRVWVVPSTSGAARGFWDVAPWRELAAALRRSGRP